MHRDLSLSQLFVANDEAEPSSLYNDNGLSVQDRNYDFFSEEP